MTKPRPLELKQVSGLTASDFEQHPVWISVSQADEGQPWHENAEETLFRPASANDDCNSSLTRVAAIFTTSRGDELKGAIYLEPTTAGYLECGSDERIASHQPCVFLNDRPVCFWGGVGGVNRLDRDHLFQVLAATQEQVFPITYAGHAGERIASGRILGFYRLSLLSGTALRDTEDGFNPVAGQSGPTGSHCSAVLKRFQVGDESGAFKEAERLVADFPNSGKAWALIAALRDRTGDLEAALQATEKGIQVESTDDSCYVTAARVLLKMERNQEALEICDSGLWSAATVQDPYGHRLRFYRGRAMVGLGLFQDAIEALKRYPRRCHYGRKDDPLGSPWNLVQICRTALRAGQTKTGTERGQKTGTS